MGITQTIDSVPEYEGPYSFGISFDASGAVAEVGNQTAVCASAEDAAALSCSGTAYDCWVPVNEAVIAADPELEGYTADDLFDIDEANIDDLQASTLTIACMEDAAEEEG